MHYLGIDYGQKRIGLALADSAGPAVPWKIIEHGTLEHLVTEIATIVVSEGVKAIVVGWPLSSAGRITERTTATDNFVKALQANVDCEVILEDERMTSSIIRKAGVTGDIDHKSAAHILQSYIDRLRNQAHA